MGTTWSDVARADSDTAAVATLSAVPMATAWSDVARAVSDTAPVANLSAVSIKSSSAALFF